MPSSPRAEREHRGDLLRAHFEYLLRRAVSVIGALIALRGISVGNTATSSSETYGTTGSTASSIGSSLSRYPSAMADAAALTVELVARRGLDSRRPIARRTRSAPGAPGRRHGLATVRTMRSSRSLVDLDHWVQVLAPELADKRLGASVSARDSGHRGRCVKSQARLARRCVTRAITPPGRR